MHLLKAMLSQEDGLILPMLQKLEIALPKLESALQTALSKLPRVSGSQAYVSQKLLDILHHSQQVADKLSDEFSYLEHIFIALMQRGVKLRESCAIWASRKMP